MSLISFFCYKYSIFLFSCSTKMQKNVEKKAFYTRFVASVRKKHYLCKVKEGKTN